MPLESVDLTTSRGGGGGSKFQPTPEELRSIQDKMKDPKFVELMHEYMQSLQDPETRREEEAYLEQAEREAKAGGDFSFEFVFPRPGFVVELANPTTRRIAVAEARKVLGPAAPTAEVKDAPSFINMCSSEKVDPHTEERASGRDSNWHVPVSVSKKRIEAISQDGVAGPCCGYVYDAVFHPQTLSLADRSDRFLCFLVEIAVEHINAGYAESNGFEFRRLSSSVKAIGEPKNQTVRRKKTDGAGASPFDPTDAVLTKPTKHLYGAPEQKAAQPPKKAPAAASSSSKAAAEKGKTGGEEAGSSSAPAKEQPPLPPHTITHRGRIDMSDAWQWKVSDKRVGVPEELVVRMTFAGVSKAAALDIDITDDGAAIRVAKTPQQPTYDGLIVLPFTVDTTPRKAALDKATGALTLVLKVVPPKMREADERITAEMKERYIGSAIEPLHAGGKGPSEAEAETAAPPPAQQLDCEPPRPEAKDGESNEEKKPADDDTDAPASASAPAPLTNNNDNNNDNDNSDAAPAAHTGTSTPTAAPAEGEGEEAVRPPETAAEYTSDADRAGLMLAKVMEARKAREAAAAAAAAVESKEVEGKKEDSAAGEGSAAPTTTAAAAAAAAPSPHAAASGDNGDEEMPFIRKVDPAKEAEEADLRARQEAWAAMVQEQMAANEEAEARENARLAALERAKAEKRLAAMKETEAREARAKAKRDAVPLSNKYILSID